MKNFISLSAPLDDEAVEKLSAGDMVLLNGKLYTARDAAHARILKLIEDGKELPFDLAGQIIYFTGPTPAPPGRPIGSAGPTTSYRMDSMSPALIEKGLKAMIGKGKRSAEVIKAMTRCKAVYLTTTGGAGALISERIKSSKIIAFEDLGPEAVRELEVENFPAVVVNDCSGRDLYNEGREKYRKH